MRLTDEQRRKQRNRNIAVAATLMGLVGLFYVITMVRFGGTAG